MQTLRKIAAEAATQFQTVQRNTRNGIEPVVRLRDTAPPWLKLTLYTGHGDDWAYSTSREALQAIAQANEDDLDETAREFTENTDVHTADLTDWLAAHPDRTEYCDDTQNHNPHSQPSLIQLIKAGQTQERSMIFTTILHATREQASRATQPSRPAHAA